MTPRSLVLVLPILMLSTVVARAQDVPKDEPRPTGLPSSMNWKFKFDAGWGVFGYRPPLFTDPKEGVKTSFGQHWMEGFAKPTLEGAYDLKASSQVYGTISAVGERTYASPPELVGPQESSFLPEDASIGWRSGKAFEGLGENAVDVTVGRTQYTIGHGMLLWDGAAEGGSRGGYWTNARKAWGFAAIGRLKSHAHAAQTFYLKKDDLPEHHTDTTLWGANYEFKIGESSTFGGTYLKTSANLLAPRRDGLNVYNARAYTAPFSKVKDLAFEFEYAAERNNARVHANAWTGQGAYQFSDVAWKPKLTYRYALFEGDDPATRTRNESFDPLFLGFSNWGTWWQGEIAGEYFISNSNLVSHLTSVTLTPNDKVGSGIMFYKFVLDHPATYAPGVTDNKLAFEVDGYTDWKINANFTASFVAAWADPQKAVQQSSGRTQNFKYGMVFLAYSY